ncbi:MAG TPA: amidohydrolase family protein [Acetobacteraceae bacterium]|nr:amidohydrolase family protein [Acetobacteraceae bacterium]
MHPDSAQLQSDARLRSLRDLGPIDCDVHPPAPRTADLLPYLDEHWREVMVSRGIDGLDLALYPPNAPISARPDFRPEGEGTDAALASVQSHVLEPWGTRAAILNCLHGAMALHSEDMGAALTGAVNAWLAREWLDRDPRLRASIVVAARSPELAVAEIERRAGDPRFVQVLMLVSGGMPLGRRFHWPIYAAAERHGLPIGIHAGSAHHHAPTTVGWPSYLAEDHVGTAAAFQTQLMSLIAEGALTKFPGLRVVLIESGVTWLAPFLWHANKEWRGLRMEVPWLDRPPAAMVRDQVRLTVQPLDGPPDPAELERVLDQIGSDEMLLFSTDYPHWHFDGADALPAGFPAHLIEKLALRNPLATYPRLRETRP